MNNEYKNIRAVIKAAKEMQLTSNRQAALQVYEQALQEDFNPDTTPIDRPVIPDDILEVMVINMLKAGSYLMCSLRSLEALSFTMQAVDAYISRLSGEFGRIAKLNCNKMPNKILDQLYTEIQGLKAS
jgi:hypothetical protein